MDDDGTGVRWVARFDPAEEGQEWSGIFGNTVVGPSRELELPDLSPLVGAALMGENIRIRVTDVTLYDTTFFASILSAGSENEAEFAACWTDEDGAHRLQDFV